MHKLLYNEIFSDNTLLKILIPPISDKVFIKTIEQQHILAAYTDDDTEYYYIFGYFVNEYTGLQVTPFRFVNFQTNLNNPTVTLDTNSAQYFVFLDNIQLIPKKLSVSIASGDKEYFYQFKEEVKQSIKKHLIALMNKPFCMFNIDGITEEDALEMCKAFDRARNKRES